MFIGLASRIPVSSNASLIAHILNASSPMIESLGTLEYNDNLLVDASSVIEGSASAGNISSHSFEQSALSSTPPGNT